MRLPTSRRLAVIAALASLPLAGAGVASATTPPSDPTDTTLAGGATDDTSMTGDTSMTADTSAAGTAGTMLAEPSGPLCAAALGGPADAQGDDGGMVHPSATSVYEDTAAGATDDTAATADTSTGSVAASADTTATPAGPTGTDMGGSTMGDAPLATAIGSIPLLSDLAGAIDAAGLTETLDGPGPFTVLAPIDSAFAKLGPDALDAAVADPTALTSALSYHVIPEQLASADLAAGGSFESVLGEEITVEMRDDTIVINDGAAAVQCMDIPAANGTLFLIDTVLMPPSGATDSTSTSASTTTSVAGGTTDTATDSSGATDTTSVGSLPTDTTEA